MAQRVHKINVSPRHGFNFNEVPTVRGSMYGGSVVVHYEESYSLILDCVYEMALDIAGTNDISDDAAITKVLADEGWTILPKHRKQILNRMKYV